MNPVDPFITRPLDGGLIVARRNGYRLFVFNASARFIWELRASGIEDEKIPSLMADHYGIDIKQAESDFRKTLQQWQIDRLAPAGHRRQYALGVLRFSVDYPDDVIESVVAPVIEHLEKSVSEQTTSEREVEFSISTEDGQFVLRSDGNRVARTDEIDEIISRLTESVILQAYDATDWLMSTHAGAVGIGDSCILLPGVSRTGKSTLTASLLARTRFRYLTDDIVLLDRNSLRVAPMPGALVLKRGSWELLASLLPDLASRAIHRRHNEDVRYWPPPPDKIANAGMSVKAVVFLQRGQPVKASLTALSPLDGLNRMIAAPATISPPITPATVDRLLQWAHEIPFYSMDYSALADTGDVIEALLDR